MFLKYGFSTNLKGTKECITNFTIFVFNSFAFVYLFVSHQVYLDNKNSRFGIYSFLTFIILILRAS